MMMATAKERDNDEQTSEAVEEECWGLGDDFDLYAKHEVGLVYFPSKSKNNATTTDAGVRNSFLIECIEPDTPLDINNHTQSSRQYDATGHCVWAGAFLLIQCIHDLEKFNVENKRVIEFGCGTGIGGIAMMMVNNPSITPSHLCFTDNDPDALKVCERNCKLNDLPEAKYSIKELTWGERDIEQTDTFDVALATDVLYDVDLIEPLFTTVSNCIPSKGIFILSHIPRACYNEGNPPEAVEDLEKYIIDQAVKYNLQLIDIIRPSEEEDGFVPEILDWCPISAFNGGGILVFQRL